MQSLVPQSGPFHIGNLFQNKTVEIFLLEVSTFTLEKQFRKPYVNNTADTSESNDMMFVNTGQLTNHSTP